MRRRRFGAASSGTSRVVGAAAAAAGRPRGGAPAAAPGSVRPRSARAGPATALSPARRRRCPRPAAAPASSPRTKRSARLTCRRHRHRLQAALASQRSAVLACRCSQISGSPPRHRTLAPRRPGHRLGGAVRRQRQRILLQPGPVRPVAIRPPGAPRRAQKAATSSAAGQPVRGHGTRCQVAQRSGSTHAGSVAATPSAMWPGWDNRRMPTDPPLILASTSRYRRELLARLRLPFAVDVARGRRNPAAPARRRPRWRSGWHWPRPSAVASCIRERW